MTTPTWLQRHLIAEGHVTETGLTRTPTERPCPTCGQRTLAGIDRNGFDARTWAWPTTGPGELAAILRGRQTWHVSVYGGLVPRSHHTIAAHPAGQARVHVEHRCDDPAPPAAPRPPKSAASSHDGPPPF